MEHAPLTQLIEALERGTNLHICVYFLNQYGNQKTLCPYSQRIHDSPVCLEVKKTQQGLTSCYRCRNVAVKKMLKSKKPMSGCCLNGVYEYCRPVTYDGEIICILFVGNLLTDDPVQLHRLESRVAPSFLETMEHKCTLEHCVQIADILESYIVLLFDTYGIDNKQYEPLVENIKGFIRDSLPFELSMKQLASTFNYTEKYLGQVFKLRTGRTIKEYYNRLKIDRAQNLLMLTDLSIGDVALQSGFNSTTYFDRVFRKRTGLSPQAFRSARRKTPTIPHK